MTPDDIKKALALRLSSFIGSPADPDHGVRAVESMVRRAFPTATVKAVADTDTEEEAAVRDVLEEPTDPMVRLTIRMPVHMDYIRLTLNVSGDRNDGDDGNDG